MKHILVILGVLLMANAASGGEGTRVENWQNVQTYDLAVLKKDRASQQGKVVGVRCSFRSKNFNHMKPNWYQGTIFQKNPDGKGFTDLLVMIARKDLETFKSLPTESGGPEIVLYGDVQHEAESNFYFVRLFGRTPKTDAKGRTTVVW
jgi:hypothetical protein